MPTADPSPPPTRELLALVEPLYDRRRSLRLRAAFSILVGVLLLPTVVCIPIAWYPILDGYLGLRVARCLERGYEGREGAQLRRAVETLARGARLQGGFAVLATVALLVMFAALIARSTGSFWLNWR